MHLIPASKARAHDSVITLTVLNAGASLRSLVIVESVESAEKHARRNATPRTRDAA
jgi:hypothetical protein